MGAPVIVDAVRTPIGKRGGALAAVHPALLLGEVQRMLLERTGVAPARVGQVVGGCVTQVGEQSFNVTRMAWLAAGLPHEVGAATLDCQCGSSQQANHVVQALIVADAIDVGIACGVEAMSRVELGANTRAPGRPKPPGFPYELPSQFVAAERVARRHGVGRADTDAYGLESQRRAARATAAGYFAAALVSAPTAAGAPLSRDEGLRESTPQQLARLASTVPGGIHTAATTSQISDGAAAVLWMDARVARAHGLRARARIRAQALVGTDPFMHIEGPLDVTRALLSQARMRVGDVDLFEINEAFAAVPIAWERTFGVGRERINVNGGAIALGHPMGATGARLIGAALHELERRDATSALIAMCCGGAVATGTLLERV